MDSLSWKDNKETYVTIFEVVEKIKKYVVFNR